MRLPLPAPLARRSQPELLSRSRFFWHARYASLDALTGQTGTLVRAATGTAVDANGTTYTAGHSAPRWEARNHAGTGARDTLGLRLVADDLTWPILFHPEQASILIEFDEVATRSVANAGLLYIGNDAQSGARLVVGANSGASQLQALWHNGSTSVTSALTSGEPTANDPCILLVHLDDDGTNQRIKLTRHDPLTASEEVTSYTSTITRAASFPASTKVRVNRTGSGGTQGSTWVRRIQWEPGILTVAQMLQRM